MRSVRTVTASVSTEPAISGCSMPGDLRLQVDPYESAKKLGRLTMQEEACTIIMQWAAVMDDKATAEVLWEVAEKVRGIKS